MKSEKQYIDIYGQCKAMIDEGSHALINQHRAEAFDVLCKQGLPTLKSERYRYTDVQQAFAPDYGLNLRRLKMEVDPYQAYRCSVPGLGSMLYYILNDRIVAKDALVDNEQLYVGSLTEFVQKYPERFATYYNKVAHDGVSALNTLLSQDGIVLWLAQGVKLEQTVQFVDLTVGTVPMMTNRRQLVILEKDAEASVLFCDHSITDQQHLTTEVAEFYLGQGSRLQYYCIEETNESNQLFNTCNANLDAQSRLDYVSVTLHNGLTRRTLGVHMKGEGSSANAYGLVVGGNKQQIDHSLLISHEAESCQSDVLYKYVLDQESQGAFAGKVYVAQGAQKTDSQETNANLCVSPLAHMFTQPMLEIYADDVKCNHGSTVGQLDESALFYMAQRGISPEEGRALLQQAFAFEVIDRIELQPLRLRLMQMVEERFRRGAGACGDCALCESKK